MVRGLKLGLYLSLSAICLSFGSPVRAEDGFALSKEIEIILEERCMDCHQGEAAEGSLRLDLISNLEQNERLEVLNRAQEQIFLGLMPPEDVEQLEPRDRDQVLSWLSSELEKFHASTLEAKLRRPSFGNVLEHEKLFSGEYADLPGFTYDRRWLISEYIFNAKINRIINHKPFLPIDGQRQFVIGSNNRHLNLTNPFLLPNHTGVRYYANETLNGGHLLTMLTNAKDVAHYMTTHLAKRDRRYLPAVTTIMALEDSHVATLKARESFLQRHIETLLTDLYGEDHQKLLPSFEPVSVPQTSVANDGQPIKKSPFHAAQPGNRELELIFRTMRRVHVDGESDVELLKRCEQAWFYVGDNPRTIQTRITFLNNYLDEFRDVIDKHRYAEKYKPFEYRPLDDESMASIRETVLRHRQAGDRYQDIIEKCMAEWTEEFQREREAAGLPEDAVVEQLVNELFIKILEREPDAEEATAYLALTQTYLNALGNQLAIEKLMQTLILKSDFVYRQEFGNGDSDPFGRRMMSPRDASYAIAYALTDSRPDEALAAAAKEGRLETREDYEREVRRMLERRDQFYVIDESVAKGFDVANITNMPIRELRFFREFFGYPKMLPIFKDNKRFGGNYDNAKQRLVTECDRLVEHIVEQDRDVFESLLGTENFYVYHSGDNEAMQTASERVRTIYEYFKDLDWENFDEADLKEHQPFISDQKMRGFGRGVESDLRTLKTVMTSFSLRFENGQDAAAPYCSFPAHGPANAATRLGGRLMSPEVAKFFNIDMAHWDYPALQPARMDHRKGILTHPAWLIAHAQNQETDPVRRGKWIREKLLAGTVPDLPITVDAVIPEDPHQTLRTRLASATEQQACWKCHQQMNPLGYAFEIYDDFGRFRLEEPLEHPENLLKKSADKGAPHVDLRDIYKTLPVTPHGFLEGTGEEHLDGEVRDALELVDRLAQSKRVRQSIIRHAFRYFMGRNEMLSDSKTLIDADRVYVESGGSFDEVIVSLLTSDSFIYRKSTKE